jgi:hypothetical protein
MDAALRPNTLLNADAKSFYSDLAASRNRLSGDMRCSRNLPNTVMDQNRTYRQSSRKAEIAKRLLMCGSPNTPSTDTRVDSMVFRIASLRGLGVAAKLNHIPDPTNCFPCTQRQGTLMMRG